MSDYNYTNGDGLTALEATTPDGSIEPVSVLDDAIRQIKAYLLDPTKGPQALINAINSDNVGKFEQWGFSTPPAGTLACNGAAVSRTTYAALFAKIGVTFGPGDSVTTFNLPDAKGRGLAGVGVGDADYATNVVLGAKTGAEGTLMTEAMLVPHTHSDNANGTARADGNTPGGGLAGAGPGTSGSAGLGTSPIPSVSPRLGVLVTIRYQ